MRIAMTMVLGMAVGGGLMACKSREQARTAQSVRITDAALSTADARPVAEAGKPTIGARVAAGDLRGEVPEVEYQVVFPTSDDATRGLAASKRALTANPRARVMTRPLATTAFDLDSLPHFGMGLTDADHVRLATASRTAVAVTIAFTRDQLVLDLHQAAAAARAGAIAGHGWIVDPHTLQVFSISAFDERFPSNFPLSADRLVTTFQAREARGGVLLQTAGLARFGLPEMSLRNVPTAFVDDVKVMVDAAAQTFIEGGVVVRDGTIDIDTARLTTEPWPSIHRRIMATGGTGQLTLQAFWSNGVGRHPDAAPVIELEVDGTTTEALAAARWAFFGGERAPMQDANVDNEAALAAARRRATTELAALAPHFARGVPEFEHLQVKAPFATDSGGNEWMWVEVHEWKGTRLRGILTNQPFDIAALKEGAEVEVQQGELFDYLHRRADGTIVGGETNKILAGE